MTRYSSTILAIASAALFVHVTGCGESNSYELAPVSGVVTLDGKVVPYTQIVFQPKGSSENMAPGPGSTAFCDDTGKFELRTVRGEPGAVVGMHAVQIYAHGPPQSTVGDTNVGPQIDEAFPARFNTETTLNFEVPAAGTAAANFKLQSLGSR